MSDVSLDDKIKEAQLRKLEAETLKVKAETSKVWFELVKFVFSGILGLGVGIFSQTTKMSWAETEKEKAIAQRDQISKEINVSVQPLKDELTRARLELENKNVTATRKPLVYVQFQGNTSREFIDELRGELKSDFTIPGAQRIAGNFKSQVRYFTSDKQDGDTAKLVANKIREFYQSKNCQIEIQAQYNNATGGKPSPIEVWLAEDNYCG